MVLRAAILEVASAVVAVVAVAAVAALVVVAVVVVVVVAVAAAVLASGKCKELTLKNDSLLQLALPVKLQRDFRFPLLLSTCLSNKTHASLSRVEP